MRVPVASSCVVSGSEVSRAVRLRLPSGRTFARVTAAAAARAHLGSGDATVEIVASPVRLVGRTRDVPLVAARAFPVAGILVPGGATPLRLVDARADAVVVEMDVPPIVRGTPAVARAAVSCADLRLDAAEIDFHALLGPTRLEAQLPLTTKIPLAAERDGAPVAELVVTDDDGRVVDVLEQDTKKTRIAWRGAADSVVVGWVASRMLEPVEPAHLGAIGVAETMPRVDSPVEGRALVCPRDVPLVVEVAGERATVGSIEPGTRLVPLAGADGFVSVALDTPGVIFTSRVLVRTPDVAECQ
jgi:hypothetical protein